MISTWFELAPRMNSEVLVPMPPLVENSTPAWLRSSERRSGAWELTMSSWVTTVVCGRASVTDCAVREAVTTTGASVCPLAACAAAGAEAGAGAGAGPLADTLAGVVVDDSSGVASCAKTDADGKRAMAARMAGMEGRTDGFSAAVDLDSVERMSRDGRERPGPFPRGPYGDGACHLRRGIPSFCRPVSGLTTSGWPPSRSDRDDSDSVAFGRPCEPLVAGVRGRLPLRGQHRLACPDMDFGARLPVSR